MPEEDLVCPDCGGPIGQTSTFCMHCSADLTDRHPTRNDSSEDRSSAGDSWLEADTDVVDLGDARDDEPEAHPEDLPAEYRSTTGVVDRTLIPDGLAIKAVGVLVALAAGLAVGIGTMYVLSEHVEGWVAFLVGVLCWLGSTAVFVRVAPG